MSRIVGLLTLAPLCLAASCFGSSDAIVDGGGPPCVAGLSVACTCADGRHGASVCQADGTMAACACPSTAAAGTGGGGGTDAPTGRPTGGTQAEPSGGQGGAGGETGGSSAGGSGGASGTGEPDAAIDSGGIPAPDAGHGMDGNPKPGEAYAPCMTTDDCHANLECAAPPFESGGRGYCTVRCRQNLGGMVTECPAPPTGSVGVVCAALSGLCQLGSCEMATCPDDMECRDQFVPSLPFGRTVYYCAYGD